jgi:hypothetical protein
MPFRDELDAAYAKIAVLESRLSEREPQPNGEDLQTLAAELRSAQIKLRETEDQLSSLKATVDEERRQTGLAKMAESTHTEATRYAEKELQRAKEEHSNERLKQTKLMMERLLKNEQDGRKRAEEAIEELATLSRPAALRLYRGRLLETTTRMQTLAEEKDQLQQAKPAKPRNDAPFDEQVKFQMNETKLAHNEHEQTLRQIEAAHLSRICAALERPAKE